MMELKADAIFEGGGIRGISFVGAISCLEEKGYQFQRLAGTSAGAIMAALLAAGYTGKELVGMAGDTDFNRFLDSNGIQSVPLLGKPLGLLLENGMYKGNYLEDWMRMLLKAKGRTRFRDVMLEGRSRLKVIASDITRREILILPDDLPKYGVDPMDFEIARAVRMSAGIPFFFNPVVLRCGNKASYIVDGGVLSNFPVWIFDVDQTPGWPTFGFKLSEPGSSNTAVGKTDLLSYACDVVDAMMEEDQSVYRKDKDSVRTISIPTLGIKSTDFNISPIDSFRLYLSGYESCKRFLKRWNFQEYIKRNIIAFCIS